MDINSHRLKPVGKMRDFFEAFFLKQVKTRFN